MSDKIHDVVILGSGPAGYTAAIYAARANLNPIMIAGKFTPGGELMNTTDVENFPGFPEGIMGPDLMERMLHQAKRFGARVVYEDAVSLDLDNDIKEVHVSNGKSIKCLAVILATGSEYKKLGIDGEDEYTGFGVSWCATCDGAFFENKRVIVIGGGDSAMEEATFLTKYTDDVMLINRTDAFKASKIMLERVQKSGKVSILPNHSATSISGIEDNGVKRMSKINLVNNINGSPLPVDADAVFIAIGQSPRTDLVKDIVDLNEDGTIKTIGKTSKTNVKGLFACGDVTDPHYRQAITAAASGCIAAQDVEEYIGSISGTTFSK